MNNFLTGNLILLLGFFFIFGCKNKDKDMLSVDDECVMNSIISSDCILRRTNIYYYDQEFGGRNSVVTGILNASNDSLSYSLPTGWYSGNVEVRFSSSELIPANASRINSGIQIFGVTGTFVTAASPSCDILATHGLQVSTCSASTGNFLYSTAYNGRSSECSNIDNGLTNANCWVSTTNLQIDISSTNPASCSVEGLQGSTCSAESGSYYYSAEYGGRITNCTTGYNSAACWQATTGKFLTSTSSACTDNSINSLTCSTNPGRYVYTLEYGGRNSTCTNNIAGSCYVTQSSKASLETNLTPDKIKLGATIFGVTGTFAGTGDWPSTAHRDQDTSPVTILAEANTHSGSGTTPLLPAGYRHITSITKDDDGLISTEVTPVSRVGWGSITCGLTQNTTALRISHCESIFGANATWDGAINGNAGQVRWKLVSRSADLTAGLGREVWMDDKTKLLWSSLLSRNLNWCKSAGSSNNTGVNIRYREDDPNDICDQDSNQNNTSGSTISACFEETGFTSTDSQIDSAGKTGMTLTATVSAPAVAWRLPTMNDYEVANAHGIRFVMPDMGLNGSGNEWMATSYSFDKRKAWTFASDTGLLTTKNRNLTALVRCVGR